MRALLSTIGSRGDVQPLVALALELKTLGHDVRMCVPPDFREWIEGLGVPVTPIGPEVRGSAKVSPSTVRPSPEQRRQMIEGTVQTQFDTLAAAARGVDVMVGATTLQVAAPSVAEWLGIPYVFAAYCPAVLPSRHHAPPVLTMLGDAPAAPADDYSALWEADARRWNDTWRDAVNARRSELDLTPIDEVLPYILTKRPWLAADATLGPWPDPNETSVLQTGAWILPDARPLSSELEVFLSAGEPPVYFGFGSNRVPGELSRVVIESARGLGRRVIVLRGWADLSLIDDLPDCITVGEVNQQALFKRVAAVVHHGGAGTTTAAARAGAPQVIIPQHYDQFYWAERVQRLGLGTSQAPSAPTTESLASALDRSLQRDIAERARSIAAGAKSDGARFAAESLEGVIVS